MTARTRRIPLKDGRCLGLSEYGALTGKPLFYFHGFPGSRLEAALLAAGARHRGIRLLAVDRPGFGLSDYAPHRTLGSWPADVAHLADALELPRFAVLGLSGGGPYALACARLLPQRLTTAGVVCGLGPLDRPGATRALKWPAHLSFVLVRHQPRLAAHAYELLARWIMRRRPEWVLHLMHLTAAGPDREVLAQPHIRQALIASVHAAVRQGGRGALRDLWLYAHPWDFALEEVTMPVHLWHGEADATVPVAMGRNQAARLPNCRARFLPDEGHFSLLVNHLQEILATLVPR